jgi:hypothetical protein
MVEEKKEQSSFHHSPNHLPMVDASKSSPLQETIVQCHGSAVPQVLDDGY